MIIPVREVIFPSGNAVPLYTLTAVTTAYCGIIYPPSHKHIHPCSFSCTALATGMVKIWGVNKVPMMVLFLFRSAQTLCRRHPAVHMFLNP